ncbi:ABC transporter ATP-binding protein [Vibrio fortis]|uniref:ABC transporter ATP-binding protein n=1 Tax=Vibrio fortis TaxID=212667 RepID=A0A5N3R0M8_9VIBR|nr:ABC transporter ATP-binding protein [Vibrio fortis]KAB0288019.1 ABC transporter ATP-binding protein [Vibrio fortis]
MYLTDKMSAKQALTSIIKSEKKRIVCTTISAILSVVAEVITWVSLYFALNSVFSTQQPSIHFALMGVAICARYFLYSVSVWQAHLAAYHIIQNLRQKLIVALSQMPTDQLVQYHRGDLEKRLNEDCQSLEPLIAHHTTDIITGILLPIALIGCMFTIDWQLGLIALIPLPMAVIAQTMMMRGFPARQKKYNQVVANMHKAQLEFLRSIGVMKLFGVDADSYRQMSTNMTKHHKMVRTYTKQMVGAWVTFITLAQASLVLVIPFAVYKMTQGVLTPVDLTMIVILCAGVLKPWLDLTQVFAQIQHSFQSVERLLPLFSSAQKSPSELLSEPVTQLRCHQISVMRGSYQVMDSLNVTFRRGDCVLLQGASGSGKSSLLATLYGELTAHQGDWFLNGQAVSAMSEKQRSEYIAVVDQHPVFFNASIRENLTLGNSEAEDSEIMQVLEQLALAKLVRELPNQLDCAMNTSEQDFSGGEKQRFAIARALLAAPSILVLDEATSHLDKSTEKLVLEAISQYSSQQIQFVISHGNQALSMANRAFSLTNGQLIEQEETVCA